VSTIKAGTLVAVRMADGQRVKRRAVSGVEEEGHDFPVVWVTTEEEWAEANGNGHHAEARPWPAEDVALADDT
jgi:hypothetical protein